MDSVRISITARQKASDGHVENVQQNVRGNYFYKGGKHYLRYQDKKLDKHNPVSTTIKISDTEWVILRRGSVSTEQRFVLNQEVKSNYQTPYGVMELLAFTHELSADITDETGRAKLRYTMSANEAEVGEYEIEIKFQ